MKPEDFDYVVKNNLCLFQKGQFSQWYGGYGQQHGGFDFPVSKITCQNRRQMNFVLSYKEDSIHFNCCEQWMMANKALLFEDESIFEEIMQETNPRSQKALGRKVKNYNQERWDNCKYGIVLEGNVNKFEQNKDIKEFLLSFNVHTIFAEAAPWDKVWGIGLAPDDPKAWDIHTWEGENLLGMVIGQMRKRFE